MVGDQCTDIDHESTVRNTWPAVAAAARGRPVPDLSWRTEDILMAASVGDLEWYDSILNEDPDSVRMSVSARAFPNRTRIAGGVFIFSALGDEAAHMLAHQFGHEEVFQLLMQRM